MAPKMGYQHAPRIYGSFLYLTIHFLYVFFKIIPGSPWNDLIKIVIEWYLYTQQKIATSKMRSVCPAIPWLSSISQTCTAIYPNLDHRCSISFRSAEGSVNFVEKHQLSSICWNKPLLTHEIPGKSQAVVMVCPLPGWRTSASSWTWSSHLRWVSGASGTPSLALKSACFQGVGFWKIRNSAAYVLENDERLTERGWN